MSMHEKAIINCDECGKEYEFNYYRSINVSLEPELKDKVISGEIFKSTCPHCGRTTYIPFPFLYHDMEHHYMVYVSTKEDIDENYNVYKEQQEQMAKDFPGIPQEEILSVSFDEYHRLETIVLGYENNLDWFYVDLYFLAEIQKINETFKDVKGFRGVFKYYLHMIDGKLSVVYELSENGAGINNEFNYELYNAIKEIVLEESEEKENGNKD